MRERPLANQKEPKPKNAVAPYKLFLNTLKQATKICMNPPTKTMYGPWANANTGSTLPGINSFLF
jgi:hypothetical protein